MSLGGNKTCSVNELPSFDGLGIASNINVGMIPRNNNTLAAMAVCCAPNSVNLVNDCVLWCELPSAMVDKAKNESTGLSTQFENCLRVNHAEPSGGITGVHSGASKLGGPNVLGVGMLTIVLGWMCAFA